MQNNVTNKLNTPFIQNRFTFDLTFSIFATAGCKSDFVCKALLPTYSIGGGNPPLTYYSLHGSWCLLQVPSGQWNEFGYKGILSESCR